MIIKARYLVRLIPVDGPGSREAVMCYFCSSEGIISTKARKASSGFKFVTGQFSLDGVKFWKIRNLGNKIMCHDCDNASSNWGC